MWSCTYKIQGVSLWSFSKKVNSPFRDHRNKKKAPYSRWFGIRVRKIVFEYSTYYLSLAVNNPDTKHKLCFAIPFICKVGTIPFIWSCKGRVVINTKHSAQHLMFHEPSGVRVYVVEFSIIFLTCVTAFWIARLSIHVGNMSFIPPKVKQRIEKIFVQLPISEACRTSHRVP